MSVCGCPVPVNDFLRVAAPPLTCSCAGPVAILCCWRAFAGRAYSLGLFAAKDAESFAAALAPAIAVSRATKTPIVAHHGSPAAIALAKQHGFAVVESFAFHSQVVHMLVRPYDA